MTLEERILVLENEIKAKKRDNWERADIIGKLLIPVAIAFGTFWYNYSQINNETDLKTLEVVIGVLQSPNPDTSSATRKWALSTFQKLTNYELPPAATEEIQRGEQLPTANKQLLLSPNSGQLRVVIIHLKNSINESEQLKTNLIEAGYNNIKMSEVLEDEFPDSSEVRFYYPADSQNAQSLGEYIKNNLGIQAKVKDKSQSVNAYKHRFGDLHVYIR